MHSWWHHQMKACSALLAFCAGNLPFTGEFPAHRPVTRSFDVFLRLCLNATLACNPHYPQPYPLHDEIIKWKHFPRYWLFYSGNSPVTGEFPAQGPVTQSFDFSLICAWINDWVNNREADDLRRHQAYCDVTVVFVELILRRVFTYTALLVRVYA